jgi:hypothetical protein
MESSDREDIVFHVKQMVVLGVGTSNQKLERMQTKETKTTLKSRFFKTWMESGFFAFLIISHYDTLLRDMVFGIVIGLSIASIEWTGRSYYRSKVAYYSIIQSPKRHGRWAYYHGKQPINLYPMRDEGDAIVGGLYDSLIKQGRVFDNRDDLITCLLEATIASLVVMTILSSTKVDSGVGKSNVCDETPPNDTIIDVGEVTLPD